MEGDAGERARLPHEPVPNPERPPARRRRVVDGLKRDGVDVLPRDRPPVRLVERVEDDVALADLDADPRGVPDGLRVDGDDAGGPLRHATEVPLVRHRPDGRVEDLPRDLRGRDRLGEPGRVVGAHGERERPGRVRDGALGGHVDPADALDLYADRVHQPPVRHPDVPRPPGRLRGAGGEEAARRHGA